LNQILEIIEKIHGIRCERNISAKKLTSYAVGGTVEYLIAIEDRESIQPVFQLLRDAGLRYVLLGAGTNILVADSGFNGVFVRLGDGFKTIKRISESTIYAGGASLISDLIAFLRRNTLGGPVFLCGIPGTIGGAIAMNAGAFGGEIAEHVLNIDVVTTDGVILKLNPDECCFGYRESRILKEHMLVLGAEISVMPGVRIDEEVEEYLARRMKNQIPGSNYAGSVFKNPSGNYAGKLIEDSGLKGLRIGTAFVSEKHANFIVADDDGSASDVFELMQIAALRVFEYFGIKLEPEIQLVGFDINWDEIFE